MTEMHKELASFWSQFEYKGQAIPAYYTGMIPKGATYPYCTFSVGKGEAFTTGIQTAFIWHKRKEGLSPLMACAESLDAVEKAIPKAGVKIPAGDGFIVLYRNDSDWLSYMQDEEDPDVMGARVSYQIYYL